MGQTSLPTATPERVVTFASLLGVIAVTLFVGTEVGAALMAGAWSLAGLVHLGTTGTYVVLGIAGLISAYIAVWTAKAAWRSETDPENN